MTYNECPACSGNLTRVQCRSVYVLHCDDCGGVCGNVDSRGQARRVVDIGTLTHNVDGLPERYFDLTYMDGNEKTRVHGFYMPATGDVVQYG